MLGEEVVHDTKVVARLCWFAQREHRVYSISDPDSFRIQRKSVGAMGLWEGVEGFWKLVVVGDLHLLPLLRRKQLLLLLLLLLQRKLLHASGRMVVVVVALLPQNRKGKRWVARREEKDAALASLPW